ncbi:MAG: signal recognition particle protein, partial [Myxococcota bacterium]|nr:signal recognition particle protein [Myxococcota bacterium]
EEDAKKILSGEFTMVTFLEQIRTLKKMGSIKDVFEKMPFGNDMMPQDLDDKQLTRVEAVILSMTKAERREPELLGNQPSRARRIAQGSGTTVKEVRDLTQRFFAMRNMMKQVGKQPGLLGNLPGFKQLNQLKQLRGANMGDFFSEFDEMGVGDPGAMMGAARARRPVMSAAERQARVAAKTKARQKSKSASKARKKNRKRK